MQSRHVAVLSERDECDDSEDIGDCVCDITCSSLSSPLSPHWSLINHNNSVPAPWLSSLGLDIEEMTHLAQDKTTRYKTSFYHFIERSDEKSSCDSPE